MEAKLPLKPARKITRVVRWAIAILIIIALLVCILPTAYYVIIPQVDSQLCVPDIARKVGVQPTHEAIEVYILTSLKPDMSRQEVRSTLEAISPVRVVEGQNPENGVTSDQITLLMCSHPNNNIYINAHYGAGKLLSADVKETN
jgi:hypothetical protein